MKAWPAAPAKGRLTLAVAALLAAIWGYWVWQRIVAVPPPQVDASHAEPMVVDAIQAATQVVKGHPRDPLAWGHLGMTLHAHDFLTEARQAYTEAARLDPDAPIWPYLSGHCAWAESDPVTAIADYRRALSRTDVDDAARLTLGEALLEQGEFDDARQIFEAVLERDRTEPRARLGMARVAMALNERQLALEHIKAASERAGDSPAVLALLATIHASRGDETAAATARARLQAINKEFAWRDPYLIELESRRTGVIGLGRRATALYRVGRGQEALLLVKELVDRYPDSPDTRARLGRMYVLLGEPARGEPHLRRALELRPQATDVLYELASAHRDLQRCVEAIPEFRAVIAQAPEHVDAHVKLGQCLFLVGDKPAAAVATREAVRLAPENPKARKNLGAVLYELGRFEEAVTELTLAAALAPDDLQIRPVLERARAKSKR